MHSIVHQESKSLGLAKDIVIGFLASIVIGLAAFAAIPLPFSPVPLALQPQIILFFSALLGPRRGAIMVGSFLLQGLGGLPVFALGASGILHLIGPRGGYLVGYLVSSLVVGYLYQKRGKSGLSLFTSMAIGNGIVLGLGVLWLSSFLGVKGAIFAGLLPFIIGDFVKLVLFAKIPTQFDYQRDL